MAELSAKKVMSFVDKVVELETHMLPYSPINIDDVKQIVFAAIVRWDGMLRSDFTTGMEPTYGQLAGGKRSGV